MKTTEDIIKHIELEIDFYERRCNTDNTLITKGIKELYSYIIEAYKDLLTYIQS